MQSRNCCAVGRITMTGRRYGVLARPLGRLLAMHVLHDPALVRSAEESELPDGTPSASGPVCVKQPYSGEVTVEVSDSRSKTTEVPDVVFETTSKEVSYHVRVPKFETVVCGEETVYELIPIEKTRIVDVCVPKIVREPVDVTVRKMVPKTIYRCRACFGKHGK